MRLDRLAVLALCLLVLGVWLGRGVSGPVWPIALSAGSTLVWLQTRRRRAWPAPAPRPARPAVLIPTHGNVATVGDVVRRAVTHGLPVYVVDDGSTDGSGEAARAAGATVIVHPVNRGKGAALLTGMKAMADAGYSHAICLDADGQHDPVDIPAFAAAIAAEPVAIYAGVRDLSTAPGISRFGRRFSNFWIWVETGWRVADSQCGFRAYPLAPTLALDLGGDRYDLEVEVLTLALWAGVPVRDLPCHVYYPPREERVSSFRPIVDNARITWMNILLIVERILWPPRWFLRPGGAAAEARWSGASRGTPLGWRIVLGTLQLLGRRWAYRLVRLVVSWYVVVARAPRRALQGYLDRMPGASVAAIYHRFGETLVDRLAFLLHGPREFQYEREGEEHLIEAFPNGGVVILSAHVGNIECAAGSSGAEARFRRLKIVRFDAAGDHGRDTAQRLPGNWRPDVIAVNREEGFAALAVVRELRAGAIVAMHGDRLIDERVVHVPLLGSPCPLPAGPWLLAALARVPVIVAGCFKEGPDQYRLLVSEPIHVAFDRSRPRDEQIAEWATRYAAIVEGWAKRYPDQWYNFHDLWTQKPPAAKPPA